MFLLRMLRSMAYVHVCTHTVYVNNIIMDCTTCTACIAFYTQNKLNYYQTQSHGGTLQMLMNIQSVCVRLQCSVGVLSL